MSCCTQARIAFINCLVRLIQENNVDKNYDNDDDNNNSSNTKSKLGLLGFGGDGVYQTKENSAYWDYVKQADNLIHMSWVCALWSVVSGTEMQQGTHSQNWQGNGLPVLAIHFI